MCEAFLGALYIDGGIDAARLPFDRYWVANFETLSDAHRDPKTVLQEWSQEKKLGVPVYKEVSREGPAHDPSFEIKVKVKGYESAVAVGKSKRVAQMKAAKTFLLRENLWKKDNGS